MMYPEATELAERIASRFLAASGSPDAARDVEVAAEFVARGGDLPATAGANQDVPWDRVKAIAETPAVRSAADSVRQNGRSGDLARSLLAEAERRGSAADLEGVMRSHARAVDTSVAAVGIAALMAYGAVRDRARDDCVSAIPKLVAEIKKLRGGTDPPPPPDRDPEPCASTTTTTGIPTSSSATSADPAGTPGATSASS